LKLHETTLKMVHCKNVFKAQYSTQTTESEQVFKEFCSVLSLSKFCVM